MALATQYIDLTDYDSDATHCSEMERGSQNTCVSAVQMKQKRSRKPTQLFQCTWDLKRTKTRPLRKVKQNLIKSLESYKAANSGEKDVIGYITGELLHLGISDLHTSTKRCSSKRKILDRKIENFCSPSTSTKNDFLKSQDISKSTNNVISIELDQSLAIDTNDVLNCVNYDNYDPPHEMKCKLEDPAVIYGASELLFSSDDKFQDPAPKNHNLSSSNHTTCLNNLDAINDPHENKIIVHSDIKISFSPPKETQIGDVNINSKNDKTQAIYEYIYTTEDNKGNITDIAQNTNENINQILSQIEEEKLIDLDEKTNNSVPIIGEVVKTMEICKKRFISLLRAKKQEIGHLRAMEAACKKDETSSSSKFVTGNLCLDTGNIIYEEELMQNMQDLQEVSEQYKRKYKNMGINLFDDEIY